MTISAKRVLENTTSSTNLPFLWAEFTRENGIPSPLLKNPVTLLALVRPSQAQLPPVHFSPRIPSGGEEWISTMAATRMMLVMHFQLEIATRKKQAPIELVRLYTQDTSFAKSQQCTCLKHSMSNSSNSFMQSAVHQ